MALTDFQRTICRLLAAHRIESGESYVAGAVALNEIMAAARISRDIDLFHDTTEALEASWAADRRLLEESGFAVRVSRERRSYVAPALEALSRRWRAMLPAAHEIVDFLPLASLGQCVLASDGTLFRGEARELQATVDRLIFHPGRIGGAWPELKQR